MIELCQRAKKINAHYKNHASKHIKLAALFTSGTHCQESGTRSGRQELKEEKMEQRHIAAKRQFNDMQKAINDVDPEEMRQNTSVIPILTCAVCGGIFGFTMEKCRVYVPEVIQSQMSLEKFVMMKVFLSAVATSMFSLSILSMVTPSVFHKARKCYVRCLVDKGFISSVIGGCVLGTGMTISGACPGMVLVQVGARVPNSVFTIGGCLLGALLYGLTEPHIANMIKPSQPFKKNFLNETQSSPYFTMSLPVASMTAMVVFGLELLFHWDSELQTMGGELYETSWSPIVSGISIGLLQIPLVLVLNDTLGGSSGYCTIVSQSLVTSKLRRKLEYLARFRSGLSNWWQVIFMVSAVGGAYLSSSNEIPFVGVTLLSAVVGGALMVFGARMAGGCTSGHGISGMGLLSLHSLITVPAMFAGGMITRLCI